MEVADELLLNLFFFWVALVSGQINLMGLLRTFRSGRFFHSDSSITAFFNFAYQRSFKFLTTASNRGGGTALPINWKRSRTEPLFQTKLRGKPCRAAHSR